MGIGIGTRYIYQTEQIRVWSSRPVSLHAGLAQVLLEPGPGSGPEPVRSRGGLGPDPTASWSDGVRREAMRRDVTRHKRDAMRRDGTRRDARR